VGSTSPCRAGQTRDPRDYRAAGALYRGDLLPEDRFEDWAEGPRERLHESHLGLLVEYAGVLSGASTPRWSRSPPR
jgi:DNA-binding SARP family transcriptional activator